MLRRTLRFLLAGLIFSLPTSGAMAEITISGDVSAGTGQITISQDYTFEITADNSTDTIAFVFDNWAMSDGGRTFSFFTGPQFAFAYNGGAVQTGTNSNLVDNLDFDVNDLCADDGYIVVSSQPTMQVGDSYTVKAGTYSLSMATSFNPELNDSTFTGDIFLTDANGNRISNVLQAESPTEPGTIQIISTATLENIAGPDVDNLDGKEVRMEMTFAPGTTWQPNPQFPDELLQAEVESLSLSFDNVQATFPMGEFPLFYSRLVSSGSYGFSDITGNTGLDYFVFGDNGIVGSGFATQNTFDVSAGDTLTVEHLDRGFPLVGAFYSQFQSINDSTYNTTNTSNTITETTKEIPAPLRFTWRGEVGDDPDAIDFLGFSRGNTNWSLNGTPLPAGTEMVFSYLIEPGVMDTSSSSTTGTFPGGKLTVSILSQGIFNRETVEPYALEFVDFFDVDVVRVSPETNAGFGLAVRFPNNSAPWPDVNQLTYLVDPLPNVGDIISNQLGDAQMTLVNGDVITQDSVLGVELLANPEFLQGIILGDMNLDGTVNLLDVDPFIWTLSGVNFIPEADCNQDGSTNLLDIDPFIQFLTGG